MSNLTWALILQSQGLYVWPGWTDGERKVPVKAPQLSGQKVSDEVRFRTVPEDTGTWAAEEYMQRWALIGHVPAMAATPLMCIDLDSPEAAKTAMAYEIERAQVYETPIPPMVLTGRGAHIYFRAPERVTSLRIKPTTITESGATEDRPIVTGGDGTTFPMEVLYFKWVVLPPTVHPRTRKRYAWAGGWRDGVYPLGEIPLCPDVYVNALLKSAQPQRRRATPKSEHILQRKFHHAMRTEGLDEATRTVLAPFKRATRDDDQLSDQGSEFLLHMSTWREGERHTSFGHLLWSLIGHLSSRPGEMTTQDIEDIFSAFAQFRADDVGEYARGPAWSEGMHEALRLAVKPAAQLQDELDALDTMKDWSRDDN